MFISCSMFAVILFFSFLCICSFVDLNWNKKRALFYSKKNIPICFQSYCWFCVCACAMHVLCFLLILAKTCAHIHNNQWHWIRCTPNLEHYALLMEKFSISIGHIQNSYSSFCDALMKLPLRLGSLSHIIYRFRPHSYHWSKSYNSIMHSNRNIFFLWLISCVSLYVLRAGWKRPRIFSCHLNVYAIRMIAFSLNCT